ncbi:MAG: hypothetical protein IJ435_08770 [Clostridia bacterium]|nr:hypothetical protein [Clostridia bacterium]
MKKYGNFIYKLISVALILTLPLYGGIVPEKIREAYLVVLFINFAVAMLVFNPRRGATPYLVCGKCGTVFPYPENRFGGVAKGISREFCPYCEKDRICYIRHYR